MATTSEVKKALDDIASIISNERKACTAAKNRLSVAITNLTAIPSTFSGVIAEINGYTPTGAFETLAKDEAAKLTTEYQGLKAAAEDAESDLSSITEF